jgi:hypothetical protein
MVAQKGDREPTPFDISPGTGSASLQTTAADYRLAQHCLLHGDGHPSRACLLFGDIADSQ